MKKALLKDTICSIQHTHRRFISMLLMAFLGVGFFAGIRAASPDMLKTIDQYYKDQNVYDIEVLSTLGLTDEDIEQLKKIEDVDQVYGTYTQDAIIEVDQVESVAKLLCLEDINTPSLIEGKLPENENECVIEPLLLTANNLKIGDTLQVEVEDITNDDGEKVSYLKQKELKIVGTAKSPIYISRDKGTTKLGSGKVNYYIYINKNNVNAKDLYTEIYIKTKNSDKHITSTEDYEDYISQIKTNIENIKEEREQARHDMLVNKATEKLESAKETFNNEKQNGETQITQAENQIASSKAQISNAESKLKTNKAQTNAKLSNAQKQIEEAKSKLKQQQENALKIQNSQIATIQKQALQEAQKQIKAQESTLQTQKNQATKQLQNAENQLKASKAQLAQAEAELETKKQEFNKKIADAQAELVEAQNKIDEIEHPTWYILDRNANQGYNSYIQDTKSVKNIGLVFPIVFFVIATLISLTSMTRMVEEERTQIGTLKALGYTKLQIASKYIIYAALACIIGGSFGMVIGCQLLPRVIWLMYSMMYDVQNFVVEFNILYSFVGLTVTSLCIIGATVYESRKELKNTPAILMRPKAPKNGKRVLLEKIPFIWNRLNFTRKVTVRNLFRYKKRFLMTIIGILGCTALIVTGFGMKDSISALLPNQFGKVFKYNMQIGLKANINNVNIENLIKELKEKDEINSISETNVISGKVSKKEDTHTEEIQAIIPKDSNTFEQVISLTDIQNDEQIQLPSLGEVAITDKLAQLLNIHIGDNISFDTSEQVKTFKVANIVENYVSHYIYMSKETYEKVFEEDYTTNVLYVVENKDTTEEQEDQLSKILVEKSEVSSVTPISTLVKTIDDMMSSLNYVVLILIVSAGILAFVVLYNLSNVNISERIRELATIKVLGFYDKEVYNYISRETSILTLIGIILGCVGGYFLNIFILKTCEINALRFAKIVNPISYVYSILITILFTIIVNIVTYFSLKKIDMIESLKSVE